MEPCSLRSFCFSFLVVMVHLYVPVTACTSLNEMILITQQVKICSTVVLQCRCALGVCAVVLLLLCAFDLCQRIGMVLKRVGCSARFWKVPTLPASFKLKDIFLDFCVACLDVNHLDIWTIVVERKKNLVTICTRAKALGWRHYWNKVPQPVPE
jgi:hypothetical protein